MISTGEAAEKAKAVRRQLHRIAEPSLREKETAAFLRDLFEKAGIATEDRGGWFFGPTYHHHHGPMGGPHGPMGGFHGPTGGFHGPMGGFHGGGFGGGRFGGGGATRGGGAGRGR